MRRTWEWFEKRAKGTYAQVWLGVTAFAESVFFPIPCDLFLIALLAARAGRWMWYAFLTTAASVAGAVCGYLLGFYVFEPVARPILELYHLTDEFARVGALFEGSTFWVTLAAAVTPIPYKVFVLSGGFFAVPFIPFILASIIGRGARFYLVAWLAHRYGPQGAELGLRYFNRIAVGVLVVVGVWLLLHFDVFGRLFS